MVHPARLSRTSKLVRAGLVTALAASTLTTAGGSTLAHPGGLALNGTARVTAGNVLELTGGGYKQTGSAWAAGKVDLRQTFDVEFTAYLHDGRKGGDGIALLVQGEGPRALGGWGGGLGPVDAVGRRRCAVLLELPARPQAPAAPAARGWPPGALAAAGPGRRRGVAALAGLALAAAAEVTTMLPYLAAIGLLTTSALLPAQVALVMAGNCLLMIAPALVLLAVRLAAGHRLIPLLTRLSDWMERSNALSWIVGIVGFLLARDAAVRLGFLH